MARKVEVQIIGDTKSLERAFGRARREGALLETGLRKIGKASAVAIGVGTGAGLIGLGLAAHASIKEFEQAQKATAQTEAVLKSTGHAANVTKKQVIGLSDALLTKTGIDDEVIQSGENMLLTFRRIRNEAGANNDIFTQATKIGLDMSTALQGAGFEGGNLKTTMIRLGKALNDPVTGMTALRRVGVTFTKDQQKLIKHLEETGHHLTAQKLILRELRAEFGGSAEAYGKTLPGQLTIFRERLRNVGAFIIGKFIPLFTKGTNEVIRFGGFIDKVAHAKNIEVGLKIAATGVKSFATDIKNALRKALLGSTENISAGPTGFLKVYHDGLLQQIQRQDWGKIGSLIAAGIGASLVFSANVLNNLLGGILSWVNAHAGQIAEVGATLAVNMFLKLTDPSFWLSHWKLALGVGLLAFGGALGRVAGRFGEVFTRELGPTFATAAANVELFFLRGLKRLPGETGALVYDMASAVGRGIGSLVAEVSRAPTLLAKAFRVGVLVTLMRAAVDGIKNAWNAFTDWITMKALLVVRKIIEPFSHLPSFLGGWAQRMKSSINRQIDGVKADQFASKMEQTAQRVANTAPKIAETARVAATLARALKSVPSDTTVRFIVRTLYAPGLSPRGGPFQGGGHAAGGRIPGAPVAADSVPAMLSPGEFVVTGGGERMLESMTFPGVLNWLEGVQPRHFAGGGRATMSKTIEYDRLYSPPMGGTSTRGLVPQVLRALTFARGSGWRGSVTSGFRTYAEQAALYARYLAGGPLAAAPGTSSHERGQAVDVTDYGLFGSLMSRAPAASRLYNRLGAADPVHYSISGYATGGRVRKPAHHAPSLPQGIREAEARAAGTPGLGDDISAYGRELDWINGQLKRRDLTSSDRQTLRVRRIRVQNRLKSLRSRQRRQQQRRSTDITLPAGIRMAEAKARLTSTLDDDIRAKYQEVTWLQGQLRKHPGRERKIALTNALADALDEYKQLLADRDAGNYPGGTPDDTGGTTDNPDLQAQLEQANARAAAAEEAARLANAFVATGVFGSSTGGGAGGAGNTYVFQSLFPYTDEQARQAAAAAAQGAGGQAYRSSSVVRTGY